MQSDNSIPEGLCQCGCGQRTAVWTRNRRDQGYVRGQPMRFVNHHASRGKIDQKARDRNAAVRADLPSPNPSGLCLCGCGQLTTVSPQTVRRNGYVKGQPRPYLPGHHTRKSSVEYIVDEATGCWVWQRAIDRRGYGVIKDGKRLKRAHRVMYERHRGPIPEGLELDHLCVNPPCVNPDHLEPVTRAENLRRMRERRH